MCITGEKKMRLIDTVLKSLILFCILMGITFITLALINILHMAVHGECFFKILSCQEKVESAISTCSTVLLLPLG